MSSTVFENCPVTGPVTFLAHALVVPTADLADKERFDKDVEAIAIQVASAWEKTRGLDDRCGFDLEVRRGDGSVIAVEVKGRMRGGEIELSPNEWAKACNLQDKYGLYVVYDCATAHPRLVCVQNPFSKLVAKGAGVVINAGQVYAASEGE